MSELVLTDLHKRFDDHIVLAGLGLTVPAGSFVALLGPSGVGKTTLLRLLAGFDRADRGTIALGGRLLSDEHTHVSPERRGIGYVPQEGSLFPHLTVAANVGFGLPRARRRAAVGELLELVGLDGLGRRYPHQLSGGQQQRVALARALAVKPEVVLLDEPFASLDAQLRAGVRQETQRILAQAGTTTVLVTHNQDEALSSADLVAVIRDGRVIQCAPPRELYQGPADSDLAGFVGDANLLDGTLRDGHVNTALGLLPVADVLAAALPANTPGSTPRQVKVLVRPEQVTVHSSEGPASSGQVVSCDYHGHDTLVSVRLEPQHGGSLLLVRTLGHDVLAPGQHVTLGARGPVLVWPERRSSTHEAHTALV